MKPILANVKTFLESNDNPTAARVDEVRRSDGYVIHTFADLVRKVAALAFHNPEYVLLFRGQNKDYHFGKVGNSKSRGRTTLLATMYRDDPRGKIYHGELQERYKLLEECEKHLIDVARGEKPYYERIRRTQYLRWAILQHYEICPTPFLDVTHSLQIAASFALDRNQEEGYLYVLGLPQISGAITVVSHEELQIVRLNSVCPPTTLRPYFQEGYLLGTFPTLDSLDAKSEYARSEVDAANRLIAKFRLKNDGFWGLFFIRLIALFCIRWSKTRSPRHLMNCDVGQNCEEINDPGNIHGTVRDLCRSPERSGPAARDDSAVGGTREAGSARPER